ncbi:MAG: HEPN domain-containing protein [Dehalococcoidia bacterium]|nr:HEPN domain-containing protein [Dehalococcoidia bacterium]
MKEARNLYDRSFFDGAYYLAGYAVECALKACIAKQTRQYDFPNKALVNQAYTHNLSQLVGVAGLKDELDIKTQSDATFAVNWAIVKDWTEDARYERHGEAKVRDFLRAIVDRKRGVLSWLRDHW